MKTALNKGWDFATGFFRDGNGETSSKRIALYSLLGILYIMVKNSIEGKQTSDYLIYGVFIGIFVCLGVITSEFFKKDSSDLKK